MALAYLLSPTFEIVNSAGKPATGGYIEVYVAGSRTKYYCASDFDGTLHPFRIPLDSLGSNIVLAEDTGAYDVYAYNRYGTSLMTRYNVKPGGGGTLAGTITSSDGSISVTPTSTGVDLRVDLEAPSILRATAQSLTGDGLFQFSELQRDGRGATVDVNGRVMLSEGWWHYDATVRLRWPGNPAESGTQSISLYTANGSDSMPFDLSYAHSDTVQINGEFKSATSGTQFILGVLGIPAGLTVELVDFGIHSILGEGAANGRYYAGNGIQINEADRIVSVDTDVVQEKLTAGTAITITDNVISAVIPPQEQADWTEADTSASSYIQHKPDLSVYATTTDLTDGLATKQDTLTPGENISISNNVISANPQRQADWAQSDSTAVDYIRNKPDLSVYATTSDLTSGLATKQDTISDIADIRAGAALGATAVQPSDLSSALDPYATKQELNTGLAGKQNTIDDLTQIRQGASLGSTALQPGALDPYALTADVNTALAGKQDTISDLAAIRSGASAGATAVQPGDLATVAVTGSYTDLSNTPSIPVIGTITL